MKTLDKRASEILRALLALQTSKIDNTDEAYMPVYIEIIDRSETYKHISLAHYGEQNGDMMRDPEMLFALHKETRQFIPYYYRNDYMGVEQYSVKWTDEGILLNRRLQADHTTFANQWLRKTGDSMNARRVVQNCVLKNQSTVIEEMIRANLISEEYLYPFADDVMEWWLIDSWLAERLKAQGEVIIEEYGCYWWGRQSSGQAIYMDGVIQEICGND